MKNKDIPRLFDFNVDYIRKHRLSKAKLKRAGIKLIASDEIFVQYPRWTTYYGSNYGRMVSLKYGKVKLLKASPCGAEGEERYTGYMMCKVVRGEQITRTITCHRLVADIFLPNYWKHLRRNQLSAHHLDHSRDNNHWKNIILLPIKYHNLMARVKKIGLFRDKKFRVMNPYDIMLETGLTLEEIIGAIDKKPLRSDGRWTIFEVKGNIIGFLFYKKGNK